MSYYKDLAPQLLNDGYIPTPVKGKGEGMLAGWSSINYDIDFVNDLTLSHSHHSVGIVCGKGEFPIAAIDIDIYDPLVSSILSKSIIDKFGDAPIRIGKKPKQLLVFCADREFSKIKTEFIDESGITQAVEILGKGQQFVAFGIHKDTLKPYEWINDSLLDIESFMLTEINIDDLIEFMNNELLSLVPKNWKLKSNNLSSNNEFINEDDFMVGVPKPATDFTEDQVIDMLTIQDPDMSNDEWVRLGMALKHWDNVRGLELWDNWSKIGKTYKEGETLKRWNSFKPSTNQITLATYWKQYKNTLQNDPITSYQLIEEKITSSVTTDDLKKMLNTLAFAKLDVMSEIQTIDAYRKKFKDITGSILNKSDVIKLIRETRNSKNKSENTEIITSPEWMDDWIFISAIDKFYRINSYEYLSTLAFNMQFNRFILPDQNGNRKTASKMAAEEYDITVVEQALYHPAQNSLFEYNGRQCVNTFNINSLPIEADEISSNASIACEFIYNHIFLLCSRRDDVTTNFMDWLSFIVQNMGIKINYAVLLQGIEGIGKSFVKELMNKVLGSNASEVSPQIVIGNFNNWADGSSFLTFEELRIIGHNRHDVVSNIKPLISNENVAINKKNVSSYTIPNVTNYLALTNYKDALPLENTDRRWLVIFAPWGSIKEFEQDIEMEAKTYFDKLFGYLENYSAEIRKWLIDYKISSNFNPKGRAPFTDEKLAMINTAHGNDDTDAIRSIIQIGGKGISDKVISVSHLREQIHQSNTSNEFDGGHHISIAVIRNLLKELGYTKFKEIHWDKKTTNVWVKNSIRMTLSKVRDLLDETEENPFA